jgi:2-keto-4-pentenoate hydratase
MNIQSLTNKIVENRLGGQLSSPADIDLKGVSPYKLQSGVANIFAPLKAWKAGGTNIKTQQYFKVKNAYFGPIPNQFVFEGSDIELNTNAIHSPLKGEVEICFRLNESAGRLTLSSNEQEILSTIELVHLCLEMPWTQFEQPSSGVEYLIADLCGANALLIGSGMPFTKWKQATDELILCFDGVVVTAGNVDNSIIKPLACYLEFVEFCLNNEIQLTENMLLATGGVTDCVELPKQKTILVSSKILPNFLARLI